MTATGAPRAREDVVFRAVAREWVIYDPTTQRLHVLNASAALVWSLCDGEHDVNAIVAVVRETLRDAPAAPAAHHDVVEALAAFAREGLLA